MTLLSVLRSYPTIVPCKYIYIVRPPAIHGRGGVSIRLTRENGIVTEKQTQGSGKRGTESLHAEYLLCTWYVRDASDDAVWAGGRVAGCIVTIQIKHEVWKEIRAQERKKNKGSILFSLSLRSLLGKPTTR